ncbi:hypothetical protein EDB85DRAFT_1888433 [Lactarius pseudohatsudake]|nr:hypothetical protein EDB85DRAFT_1888433 [Lactarius pseudohatsudake]
MQPLKHKRDEFPTTPQKLMKIRLTVGEYTSAKMSPGRRLTCVVPGPLVIPATPSPPPPPPPEDQVLCVEPPCPCRICVHAFPIRGTGETYDIKARPLGSRETWTRSTSIV